MQEAFSNRAMNIRHKILEFKKAMSEQAPQFEKIYHLGERLGTGGFAAVYSCEKTGHANVGLAVKVFDRKSKSGLRRAFRAEVKLMQEVTAHEHCVQMLDAYEGHQYCHIVMELCGCTLLQALLHSVKCECPVSEQDLAHVFKGMLSGVQHLHKCHIVHRDIKPANLLLAHGSDLSNRPLVKVCDLGLAAKLDLATDGVHGLQGKCGTLPYMAPEILFKDAPYFLDVDLWSCGVTAYVVLMGQFPFEYSENTSKQRRAELRNVVLKPWDDVGFALSSTTAEYKVTRWPTYQASNGFAQPSAAALKFLRSLLMRNPLTRATARSALCSDYIKLAMLEAPHLQASSDPTPRSTSGTCKSGCIHANLAMMEDDNMTANASTNCGSSDNEPPMVETPRRDTASNTNGSIPSISNCNSTMAAWTRHSTNITSL
jgi:serine/threonine protein kinase